MQEAPRRRVIKKVDGGHGHHGGAWKVAYADFVTAMMALFMVMWLLASTDQQTRKEISQYFRSGILPEGDMAMNRAAQFSPSVIEAAPAPPPPGEESIDDTVTQLKNHIARMAAVDPELAAMIRNVHIEVTPDGILIEAVDDDGAQLFDLASAKLKEPLERFLRAISPMIASLNLKVEIDGHTDARPFVAGAKLSNWDLSYQRAAAARDIMVSSGLPESQLLGVYARGSSQPYVKTNPYAAQNRRLSILLHTPRPAPKGKLTEREGAAPAGPAAGGVAKPADTSAGEHAQAGEIRHGESGTSLAMAGQRAPSPVPRHARGARRRPR